MSNFYDYASYEQDWKHQPWKTNTRIGVNPPYPTAPLVLQSTSTETAVSAGATKDASADQTPCLQNCQDAFRDSILSYDKDFDKICAVLSNENDDAVFATLYICDEGCGIVVDNSGGAGQDPNVNTVFARCQSLGFSNVVDPGPPQTESTSKGSSSALSDQPSSTIGPPARPSSVNSLENGQPSASIITTATTTAPNQNISPLPDQFTSTSRSSLGRSSLALSTTSSNMYLSSTTVPTSSLPTAIYSPAISSIPTSIVSDPGALSISSPFPASTSTSSTSLVYLPPPSTSSSTTQSKMNPNNTAGIILAIMGIVLLLSATIVVLFLRRKQRAYFRSLIAKARSKDKEKDRERELGGGMRESGGTDRCACCYDLPSPPTPTRPKTPRRYSRSVSGTATPDSCILNLAYPPSPRNPIKERHQGRQQEYPVEQSPLSPITVHVGGITKQLFHTRANSSLPMDAQGIRWPEPVNLKGEAKEFMEWSQGWSREYDKRQEERRARVYAHIERARDSVRDSDEGARMVMGNGEGGSDGGEGSGKKRARGVRRSTDAVMGDGQKSRGWV